MSQTKFDMEFIQAALTRAIRTICQTALSMIGVGMGIGDISWSQCLSISLVAGFVSVLTSVVTGLPETTTEGSIKILSHSDEEGDSLIMGLKMDKEVTPELAKELLEKGSVNLRVEEG